MTCQVSHSFQRPNLVKKPHDSFKYTTQIPHQMKADLMYQPHLVSQILCSIPSRLHFPVMYFSDHFIGPVPSFNFILVVLFSGAIMPTQFFLLHVALTSISITTVFTSSRKSKGISSLIMFVHVVQRKEHRRTWGCLAQNLRMQTCCVG